MRPLAPMRPLALALVLLAAPLAAQEGAKPEINRPYVVNTDVARWNKSFENERREVYVKRTEIVAAAEGATSVLTTEGGVISGFAPPWAVAASAAQARSAARRRRI